MGWSIVGGGGGGGCQDGHGQKGVGGGKIKYIIMGGEWGMWSGTILIDLEIIVVGRWGGGVL